MKLALAAARAASFEDESMGRKAAGTAARTVALAAEAGALPPGVPLNLHQAAAVLQISTSSLRRLWKSVPGFPQPYMIGNQLRFDRADIDAYLNRCREGKGRASREPGE